MKIRQGFVSNSSSSSFMIRGAEYSVDIIKETFKDINIEDYYDLDINPLIIESTKCYFSDDENESFVLGLKLCRFEDGVVTEVPEFDEEYDDSIRRKLKELGLPEGKIRTFVQFISNDNY